MSCGIMELYGFRMHTTPTQELRELVQKYELYGFPAIFLWSHHSDNRSANGLAALIKENNLGKVTKTSPVRNTNSGNNISVWFWAPNRGAVTAWARRTRGKEKSPGPYYFMTTRTGQVMHALRSQNLTICGVEYEENHWGCVGGDIRHETGVTTCRNCLRGVG